MENKDMDMDNERVRQNLKEKWESIIELLYMAAQHDKLAVAVCKEKDSGKVVDVLCVQGFELGDSMVAILPVAKLYENPHEELLLRTNEGDDSYGKPETIRGSDLAEMQKAMKTGQGVN